MIKTVKTRQKEKRNVIIIIIIIIIIRIVIIIIAPTEYVKRHDRLAKIIHQKLAEWRSVVL